jgi:threonine/homoserine/homoserine lactone efflux protein
MPLNVTIGPLALFALVASITPGPNNLLLMRSGQRFGVRRTLWHLSGVEAGFVGLMLLSYLGIGALLLALPMAFVVLRWACFAYLLWLAIAILRDARAEPGANGRPADSKARPMSFFEGLMFQLINPKAWMMAVTVASAFYGSAAPNHLDVAVATLISVTIGTPCMLIWTGWGAAIDRVLTQPRARRAFGYFMAALVLATALWMLR